MLYIIRPLELPTYSCILLRQYLLIVWYSVGHPLLFFAASSLEVSRKLLFAWLDQLKQKFLLQSQLPNEQIVFTTQTFNFYHSGNLDINKKYPVGRGH